MGNEEQREILKREFRQSVINHIRDNARRKGIYIERLNGDADHLHCLFGLNADITIAKTLQMIKGESAYWINKEGIVRSKFEWADEYYAVSVSESVLEYVRAYIDNQEEHHKKKLFTEEVEEFLAQYNLKSQG